MTAQFLGMNPDATGTLADAEHIRASIRDILLTPVGSRVMRREYGSLLPDLLDAPMNATTRLQCMSAAVIALARWEPRITPEAVDVCWSGNGSAAITVRATLTQTMETLVQTVTMKGGRDADH
ncbi:TPA: GPW/gp25 family protein [Escherichia coli]|nr:GPW/gp25 family protein [Escherichia coli]